ncbi:type I polyketide synthase [Saccharopolyspora shandongensis]|uniref:type I polyketide synthase n=1 Tax=Saccharopolyspora shandongensis TaxID=418495 RepID=UPI0034017813
MDAETSLDVAIVGLACRFPGAADAHRFWANLTAGVESVTGFSTEEFLAAGGDPAALDDEYLVRAEAAIEGIDLFDAQFFGYPPAEAAGLDPQHRLFLECAYHALEDAACAPDRFDGAIGVYAGAGHSQYFLRNIFPHLDAEDSIAMQHAVLGTAGSTLVTRVAYALGLTGPAIAVQTACSTSLVATHLAAADLLAYRCDAAIAGGVSLNPAPKRGYRYVEGGPFSPDGHCRAFDARAAGMVAGDGVGAVVLKRLDDALAAGHRIYAVLKGSAVNNDGRRKLGFTAPSVGGQAEVIEAALAISEVAPAGIGYVEAHGTGTPIGDPIEVAALARAYGRNPGERRSCALGSVKTNIGHTDAAAGIAGLIKAVLAVHNGQIPPSLHFTEPNPHIDFDDTPFFVPTAPTEWPTGGPRRAAVNSLGIGGTNAHVILEQAPTPAESGPPESWSVLLLSAKTPDALADAGRSLGAHLRDDPAVNVADAAYTTQLGRTALPHRHAVVCRDAEDAAAQLLSGSPAGGEPVADGARPGVVFMFPGAGAQYPRMGRDLYETVPLFRAEIDRCAELLSGELERDLRTALYGSGTDEELIFPGLVATEYALAKVLMSLGVTPAAMIGHSIGEYVAACVAGVLDPADLLPLVVRRERLMRRAAGSGLMLSVAADEATVRGHLSGELSLAAVNGPAACTVSGASEAVHRLRERLIADGVECQPISTPGAAHSALLEPMLAEYAELVAQVPLEKPRIPYLSNATGTWITSDQATDPQYWSRHTRETVRFADGIGELTADGAPLLLEVGPGRALSKLVGSRPERPTAVPVMRHAKASRDDVASLLDAVAALWRHGVDIDWAALHAGSSRAKISLPGYPFQRRRYWIDPPARRTEPQATGIGWNGAAAREMAEAERRLRADRQVHRLPADLQAGLDELAARYVCEFLRRGGISTRAGSAHGIAELATRLRVVPKYHRLLAALLRILHAAGVATVDGDAVRFRVDAESLGESGELSARLAAEHPEFAAELDYVRGVVGDYDRVLRGELAGNEVLLPDGDDTAQREIIDRRLATSDIPRYRELIATTLARLVTEAGGRRIRVLEVGAGRGYLSWVAAEALAGANVEYHFTDLGRSFVLDGQRRAGELGLDFLRFGVLDIDADPVAQGYPAGGFDVVLAFNVLHATPDLRRTVRNVGTLLAPGGALFLLEASAQRSWSLMSTGLYDGWWSFQDDLRADSPLVSSRQWVELLRAEGFDDVAEFPTDAGDRDAADHAVVVGRRQRLPRPAPEPVPESSLAAATSTAFNRRPALATEFVPPAAGPQQDIAAIWRDVLGLDEVGANDNFFDLGGESLLAMQIVVRVRDRASVGLALRDLFDAPTVAELAALVAERSTAQPQHAAPLITPSSRRTTTRRRNGEQR